MNAFKRKSLYAAVAAGLGAMGSMQAGAVNIGTDNTGEVLLYPYYTVRNNYVTSLSVVNTSTVETKVVKVRFLEGRNSAEVLDFNLFLSPRDVWTGSISNTTTGASLSTVDRSCTIPTIPAGGQPFVNTYYVGLATGGDPRYDGGGTTLDRVREGYVEVIEMGVVLTTARGLGNSVITSAVKHGTNGTPSNCGVVQTDGLFQGGVLSGGATASADGITAPTGGLHGNGIIIDAAAGVEFAYTPVALANFTDVPRYFDSGSVRPSLRADASPNNTVVFDPLTGSANTFIWTNSRDAVSAALMHSQVMNEYDVSPSISARTDWIITQPTKRFYTFNDTALPVAVPAAGTPASATAVAPYTKTFRNTSSAFGATGYAATVGDASACETIFFQVYDREEAPYPATAPAAGPQFSPVPTGTPSGNPFIGSLCWEATVVTMVPSGGTSGASNVFSSINGASITLGANGTGSPVAPNYTQGWASIMPADTNSGQALAAGSPFDGTGAVNVFGGAGVPGFAAAAASVGLFSAAANNTVAADRSFRGLPIIGFAAIRANALAGGGGLGGVFNNKDRKSVV